MLISAFADVGLFMVSILLLSCLRQAVTQIDSMPSPCVLIDHKAIPILIYMFLESGESHFLGHEKIGCGCRGQIVLGKACAYKIS